MDITTSTPAEIDTRLAEISEGRYPFFGRIEHFLARRREMAKYPRRDAQAQSDRVAQVDAAMATAQADLEAYNAVHKVEQDALDAEFIARGRWTRYFLVPNGHFHRSTHCSSCRHTTRFGWLPEMSEVDEDAAIEKFGHQVCTVCFPDAPVLDAPADPGVCAHSGDFVRYSRKSYDYHKCACGRGGALTKSGRIRKHRPADA